MSGILLINEHQIFFKLLKFLIWRLNCLDSSLNDFILKKQHLQAQMNSDISIAVNEPSKKWEGRISTFYHETLYGKCCK
jgi:hypothetical protein